MRPTVRIFALGLLAATALSGLPRDAAATNGMNPICYGTDNCGMGGAGIALGGNTAGAILNPALSGRAGKELLISAGWLHANVTGQVKNAALGNNQPGTQDSNASDFPDGTLALNWKFNDQWAANLAAFPGGGGATDWPERRTGANINNNGPFDHQIRTRYFFFEPSVSYTPPQDKNWSFGLGAVISYQDMKTDSLGHNGAQLAAANKQKTDSSMGAGFHLGVFWQPDPIISLGATYRSRVWSERYEEYRLARIFQGPMDMPATWGVGLALKPPPVPKLTLAGDIKHIAWQSVKSIGGKQPADGGFGCAHPLDDQADGVRGALRRMGRARRQHEDIPGADQLATPLSGAIDILERHFALELIEELVGGIDVKIPPGVRAADDHDDELRVLPDHFSADRRRQMMAMGVDPTLQVEGSEWLCHIVSSCIDTRPRNLQGA